LLEKQGLAAQQMYTGRQDTIKSAADSNDSNGPGEIFEDINQSIAENNIDKSDETEIDKKPPQMHGARVADVAAAIRGSLKDDRPAPSLSPDEGGWNIGLDPEQEEEMRKWIGSRIVDSLKAGPVIHEPRLGKNLIKPDMGSYIKNLKIVDPDAVKPKDFLNAEYNGRCQICATELMLINGGKYFEVYHIFESRGNAFWADRPFNILSLCPNCHALAKHGGRDMSNIYSAAKEVIQGSLFPVEVVQFRGDFYVIPVNINGKSQELKISKTHMSYLVELFKAEDEAAAGSE